MNPITQLRSVSLITLTLVISACKQCPEAEPPDGIKHPKTEMRTLSAALHEVAPSYRPKAPAGSEKHLGHRLVADQPETNACFLGDESDAPTGGWDLIKMRYDTSTKGGIAIDFGSIIQVPLSVGISGGGSKMIELVLGDVREHSLKSVFFNADGACAKDFKDTEVNSYKVITRAIKAGSITVGGDRTMIASANINVAKIGGAELTTDNKSVRRWEGSSLFFADYPECLDVEVEEERCENNAIGAGNTCNLGTCSFQVETLKDHAWTGTLSCQSTSEEYAGKIGVNTLAKKVAEGVSYNAQVVGGGGPDSVTIVLRRWSVRTGQDCG